MADPIIPPVVTPPTNPVVSPQENTTVNTTPAPAAVIQTSGGNSSKSMLLVILAAFIVVAILVGVGIYMYTQVKEANPVYQQISQSTQESLTSAENDLAGVKEDNVEADFAEVDKDLNSL